EARPLVAPQRVAAARVPARRARRGPGTLGFAQQETEEPGADAAAPQLRPYHDVEAIFAMLDVPQRRVAGDLAVDGRHPPARALARVAVGPARDFMRAVRIRVDEKSAGRVDVGREVLADEE